MTSTLMLAHHNDDVDDLNHAARALARHAGHLTGPDTTFPTHHGHDIPLATGDVVLLRTNTYRHGDGPDLLNGTRGIITHVDPHAHHITLTWHDTHNQPRTTRIDADYIASGGLEHGYATTVHKAQGQTADHVSLYSLDANRATLYTGMSRDRITAHTFQPATTLTIDITLQQWQAMTPDARRTQVIQLMRDKLTHQQPATMASHELKHIDTYTQTPPHPRHPNTPQAGTARPTTAPDATAPPAASPAPAPGSATSAPAPPPPTTNKPGPDSSPPSPPTATTTGSRPPTPSAPAQPRRPQPPNGTNSTNSQPATPAPEPNSRP
ncbi:ATP-binding domain-containing protein [Spirillospora sp. NPDC052242]